MDGAWHHIVFTFTTSNINTLYINGVSQILTVVDNANISSIPALQQPLFIGAQDDAGSADTFSPGTIDDVRFYNRALSATEILNLYSDTAP